MEYAQALQIAEKYLSELRPHCDRIEIAGSIRRKKPQVKDIELVAIPKPYQAAGLFVDGIATVVNQWQKIKGELPCKYTQRILPEGIALDLFFPVHSNFGLIYLLRTGSKDFNQNTILTRLKGNGYKMEGGNLWYAGRIIPTPEEADVFLRAGMAFVEPENRNL